ncbi:MAG: type IV pili twitching motility protein PilT, partial [Gammaproteobacteria bacterium]|nr:type IV pili twitching motility protein PilT [Gammaproteobacteria bacterium]
MTTPIDQYLNILARKDGSDLYLSTGAPPCAKFQGVLKPLATEPFKPGEIEAIANAIMDEEQRAAFAHELEMNLAISIHGVGRFRINIFKQRNEVAIVARNIKTDIPQFSALGLPEVL